ncbi:MULTISPECIES: putative phage tail protein [Erysipelotrichaceae]|jgi:hypothetical protein|uniref:putative phage tail protein n=1 Tax=Erysipelotrichaceae TaxID=128827 RepID=UPI000E557A1E|nr:putative phage tail protein [Absiella sp. AM27-20]RHU07193.1 DUF2313 domain-containing protein [Absiella sp. AM27-20]DAZ35751.1 MAG TPA: tail protein [Caudoviricetes sp.]
MVRKIDIIQYLPPFMREYLQLKLITDAENKVLQDGLNQLKKIDDNQYITTADSVGLKRFEVMLGITNTPGESIESRRKKILSKWNDQETYTYALFLKKLDLICGTGNYRIVEHFKQYMIELHTNLSAYGEMEELERVIDYMLPCNIIMNLSNDLVWEIKAEAGILSASSFISVFECSDCFNDSITINGNLDIIGGHSTIEIMECSDQANEKIDVHSTFDTGNGLSAIMQITVSDNSNETLNINSDASLGAIATMIEVITNER